MQDVSEAQSSLLTTRLILSGSWNHLLKDVSSTDDAAVEYDTPTAVVMVFFGGQRKYVHFWFQRLLSFFP